MLKSKKINILITGCAGFIGFHLCKKLVSSKINIIGIDNLNKYYDLKLKKKRLTILKKFKNFSFYKEDIRNKNKLIKIFNKHTFTIVFHMAAQAGVRNSILNSRKFINDNITGYFNILELCREFKIDHLIYASSSSVYGDSLKFPIKENFNTDNPLSFYAATKKSNEVMAHAYANIYKLPLTCLRFFTVYGPRQRPDLAIHKFALKILAGEPIPFFGDGSTRRDYTFVQDIVAGIRAAMDYRDTPFEVLNLGNNRTVSLSEMVQSLELVLGKEAVFNQKPEQPGDVPQTWADISKAEELLSYCPSTSFDEGILEFATWIKDKTSH